MPYPVARKLANSARSYPHIQNRSSFNFWLPFGGIPRPFAAMRSEVLGAIEFKGSILGNGATPFSERTHPKIPMVLSPDQVPPQIKKIMDSSMCSHELLSLCMANS